MGHTNAALATDGASSNAASAIGSMQRRITRNARVMTLTSSAATAEH
jgi:hypothetical protein